ncbi:organic cation transporter protein isoform X1 [Aedes albopictus]|uniref:Major facilitator superfamily (MFS) profile domain-containing protein n=1 Tax=Aedes albopictus TaxID=7160 RepID=A0ABM1Y0E5_AEDAL
MADFLSPIIKDFGTWQLRAVMLIHLVKIPSSWFMACIIFTAPAPRPGEYYCKPPISISDDFNRTKWIMASHPVKGIISDGGFAFDYCNVFNNSLQHYHDPSYKPWQELGNRSMIHPCESFEHHAWYTSIVTQFDLVCSRYLLIATTQSFHLFGVLLGGIITTQLMKTVSPRNAMLLGMYTQILCGCITGYIYAYEMHALFRCLSAICCGFMYTAGSVILNDITGGKFKTVTICMFEQFWSIGVMLLPGVASFWGSWSQLYLAISLPTFLLIILHRWIPDSPRWLLKHGRIREAKVYLMDAAKCNGTEDSVPSDFDQQLKAFSELAVEKPDPDPWWSIWSEKGITKNLVCVHTAWAVFYTVYYAALVNITAFGRDHIQINTVVAGASEMLGCFVGLFLIMFTKEKWLWTGLFNVVGGLVAFTAWWIPPDVTGTNRVALLMLTAMVSKASISCCLAVLFTCTAELIGASKKIGLVYSCTIWGRFWFLLAPFVAAMVKLGQLIPLTAIGVLVIFGGLFMACIRSPMTHPPEHRRSTSANSTSGKAAGVNDL